ncbi:MAG TPA: polyketide synthase dehydratase domain-containing protein, partial [Solirubrobacteraceae bacterium]|nr:polyketide synthase dehydratase domain-containing protein [Solirubrobacteraceae bacterium]
AVADAGGEDVQDVQVTIEPVAPGRPHYRARASLCASDGAGRADAGAYGVPAPLADAPPFPLAIEDAYRELLFHGPLFQGVEAIDAFDERGASALLRPSQPGRCVTGAEAMRWLLDPVLIDCALQVQVLWARLRWDVTLLPAQIGAYALWASPPDEQPVRHELRIREQSSQPLCHADHWFYAADGSLLAVLRDVVGVGAQALNRLAGAPR